ncbi:GtrA family protein [Sinorhizobium fredii]|uniref:GtrA family protein n=1 Tax=Rhizobium fredii TaxID=380 RepID=UPI001FCA70D0|nr:GtrA family protein [Sinorhizobium fredii]
MRNITSMPSSATADRLQAFRFVVVGLANTGFGYAVILAGLFAGLGDIMANALGYAAGLVMSFTLNSRWTFRASVSRAAFVRYLAVFLFCFGVNLAIVLTARQVGFMGNPLVHLFGISVYAILFYLGAARFVFAQDRPFGLSVRENWPELSVLTALIGAYVLLWNVPVSHDVVWQMWIARQMLGGATLYKDILELNPPLWFWIALPVEWVAVKLGISGKTAIVAIVFSYLALAIGLLASLLTDLSPARRGILLVAALLAVTLIGVSDFAQREHLALIAAVPYTALISRRADGRRPDWALAFLIGCFAAIGLALKHYFALVPILLELWLLAKNRRKWQPLRPEVVAMGAVAVLYGIALVTLAPDYLSTIVPMLTTAYFGYESSWSTVLFMPPVFWWALALALVLAPWRQMHSYHVAAALSAIGFALSYFAQQKGWRYHAIPATGMLFIALAALLELHLSRVNILRNVVLVVAMSVPLVIFALIGPYKNASKGEVSQLLQDVPRGNVVMMVTANPSRIWPMVDDGGYIWPSRHFALWMLTAFSQDLQRTGELSPKLTQMANLVRRQTVVDLSCSPPDVIIVDNLERSKASGLDPISFLSEDPAFGAFFANYTKVRSIERFTSYFKAAGWQPSRPKDCRTIF